MQQKIANYHYIFSVTKNIMIISPHNFLGQTIIPKIKSESFNISVWSIELQILDSIYFKYKKK